MILGVLLACAPQIGVARDPSVREPKVDTDSGTTPPDSGGDSPTDDTAGTPTEPDVARWNFLVFMNGDNNLESYVVHDLNELEAVGSGDGVNVLVQVDRVEGYDDADGDWTGTRRYLIQPDADETVVASPVIEDLGELDMGDPAVLADFLAWASTNYPAERTVLILWDHGDSWMLTDGEAPPPPSISSDETTGSVMSIAQGELSAALEEHVAADGKLDLIGFDACLMGSWEVAHSLQDQADWMLASELSVGWEGYRYGPALAFLRGSPESTPRDLAEHMVNDMVAEGTEPGESAIDLGRLPALSAAVDALAGVALAEPEAAAELMACRDRARGVYPGWEAWYLDLGSLTDQISRAAPDTTLGDAAADVRGALDEAVAFVQGTGPYHWTSGLSIFTDTSNLRFVNLYAEGVWASDTRWDDLLYADVAGTNNPPR